MTTTAVDDQLDPDPNARSGGWISVEDRLPSTDESVLVVETKIGCEPLYRVAAIDDCGDWAEDQECMIIHPSHWMPLPAPPHTAPRA
ncbi:DUF551 domain-containing protein [Halomonas sp. I1]|uniref:DUF551 domain-containing protein n=1 Tax=Halomonas sp. I1 TaxID=393536 RepID=UPI0028E09EE9|nr:DUF551 domain-containing protein [Halomonas sp. I1]MDT8894222.1 DUF551 domain-containing protein [Halomonas sp. I1]